ncbi:hypothetical protein BH23BAC1_BH23BAC1_25720 [soil metagenome]
MALQTGENEQALRKIIDLTRMLSIFILLIHLYLICYSAFQFWELTNPLLDRIVMNFGRLSIFESSLSAKASALLDIISRCIIKIKKVLLCEF